MENQRGALDPRGGGLLAGTNVVKVMAVQGGVGSFARQSFAPANGGKSVRPDLIVFPAFAGLGLVEGSENASSFAGVLELARQADRLEDRIIERAMELAARTGAVVVPGSVILPVGDSFVSRSYVVTADGVVARQDATHAGPFERSWPLKTATSLEPVPTPVGVVGLVVGWDAFVPEVWRILALQGADIICVPQAMAAPYSQWHQLPGVWAQVQQNQVYAVEACLVGEWAGQAWAGVSALHGPVEITPGDTGYLSQAQSHDRPDAVAGVFDFTALRSIRSAYPIFSFLNRPLYRAMMPGIYRGGDGRGGHGRA